MACVHEQQRMHAQIAMMCCGTLPMRADPHWFGVFYEDSNVYHIHVSDEWPGPSVTLAVGALPLDRWPCITIEHAEKRAREVAFGPETDHVE
jgi:hypothetical protein